MKKICFVIFDMAVVGGVEQVTTSLTSALSDFCEVHVVALIQTGDLKYKLDDRVKYSYLTDTEKRFVPMQRELKKPLAEYMKKNGIDVCFIQGTYTAFICYPARYYCKTKFVFCDHGALINQFKERTPTVSRFLASLFCHKTVTLTERSFSDYHSMFLVPKRKLKCIYNWIDCSGKDGAVYDISSKRIVSAGRLGHEKGFDMLVEACEMVFKKHPDWCLDIFGDGEMMPKIKQMVAEKGLENNVNLLGMRSDLKERYKDYAMYVLPSYREGMPLVLLEAKLNRLPVVSFDILTGPREIVRDKVDGILVKPYDINGLADAICTLIEDEGLRQKMSDETGGNLQKFSKETVLKQWLGLIEDLAK